MSKKIIYRTDDLKANLCDCCEKRATFPECMPAEVEFGTGVGLDNIIGCSNYSEE